MADEGNERIKRLEQSNRRCRLATIVSWGFLAVLIGAGSSLLVLANRALQAEVEAERQAAEANQETLKQLQRAEEQIRQAEDKAKRAQEDEKKAREESRR